MNYIFIPPYYPDPTQVKYYDANEKKYVGGICLYNILIRNNETKVEIGDYINSVIKQIKIDPDDVIIELEWTDISKAIYDEENE